MADKPKTTAYQRLKKAATNNCKVATPASAERLKKAESAYKKAAEKKGKSSAEISAIISRTKKCPKK